VPLGVLIMVGVLDEKVNEERLRNEGRVRGVGSLRKVQAGLLMLCDGVPVRVNKNSSLRNPKVRFIF